MDTTDICLYCKQTGRDWIYLLIYEDDSTGMTTRYELLDDYEAGFSSKFRGKNLQDLTTTLH
jgi:hypothetical protein